MSKSSSAKRVLLLLGLAFWVATPLVALVVIIAQDRATGLVSNKPVWADVRKADSKLSTTVDIALKWDDGTKLVAPAWQGTVQSVAIKTGQKVENGDVVATIDGVHRIAWITPGAFYRVLKVGDVGPDVGWLNRQLRERGLAVGHSTTFDYQTAAGVKSLALALGAHGDNAPGQFDPSWVLFLPKAIDTLTSVDITAGQPVPTAGSQIAAGAPGLQGATVVRASQDTDATDQTTPEQRLNTYNNRVESSSVATTNGSTLLYAGTRLQLATTRGSLAASAVKTLRKTVTRSTEAIPATLSQPRSSVAYVVPAASVTADATATVCIRSETYSAKTFTVKVLSGQGYESRITGDFPSESEVRVPGPSAASPCR